MNRYLSIFSFALLFISIEGNTQSLKYKLSIQLSQEDSIEVMFNHMKRMNDSAAYEILLEDLNFIEFELSDIENDSINALLYQKKAALHRENGNLELAEINIEKSIEFYEKLRDYNGLAHDLIIKSNIYRSNFDFDKAMELCWQSLKMSEKTKNKNGQAKAFIQLGICSDYDDDYDKAILYYQKGLKLYIEMDNKLGMANGFNNIGVMFDIKEDNDSALYYYHHSLRLEEELMNNSGIAGSKVNIALIHQNNEEFEVAEIMFNEALDTYKIENDKFGVNICYMNLADLFMIKEDFYMAEEYIDKAIEFSYSHRNMIKVIESFVIKVSILKEAKRYKNALETQSRMISIKDSVLKYNTDNEVENLRQRLDEAKEVKSSLTLMMEKEREKTKELEFHNQRIIVFAAIVFLLFLAGILFYSQVKSEK